MRPESPPLLDAFATPILAARLDRVVFSLLVRRAMGAVREGLARGLGMSATECLAAGLTVPETVAVTGCTQGSANTLQGVAKSRGGKTRREPKKTAAPYAIMGILMLLGMNNREIAERVGQSTDYVDSVRQQLQGMGAKLPEPAVKYDHNRLPERDVVEHLLRTRLDLSLKDIARMVGKYEGYVSAIATATKGQRPARRHGVNLGRARVP